MKGYENYNIVSKNQFSFTHLNEFNTDIFNLAGSNEKPTLLVFDNNKKLRNDLSHCFAENYKIVFSSNGLDASEIAMDINPELIITGTSIHGLNGFEVCREIKSNLKLCHIPLILFISKNTISQKIKGYEVGADNIIPKPFDINLLAAQVKRLIENRKLIKEKYHAQNFMVEPEEKTESNNERFVKTVKEILRENLADPDFNVQKLAGKMNSSTTQLYRNLKEFTGYTPVEFIRMFRLQFAYNLLIKKDLSVSEVCFQSGFNHASYFIKCFKKMFGSTPANLINSFANKGDNLTRPLEPNIKNSKYNFYKSVG
jgi:AraC-like DNA-binding protein/CheY-like chemotaxis protein